MVPAYRPPTTCCVTIVPDPLPLETLYLSNLPDRKPLGHVRQAGGDSRLKLRRHGYSGRGWKVVCGRCTPKDRDRRHGGLCCDHSAAIKPCAFGAPLRGYGGLTAALRSSVGHPCRSTAQWIA